MNAEGLELDHIGATLHQIELFFLSCGFDGCINAKFPAKWLKIAPPIKRNMTDEQRAALSERAKNLFGKKDSADEEETEDDE